MKKAIAALMLMLGAFAFAQDSDDFFSDSDDTVLDKARQKYEERQESDDAEAEADSDKQRAIDLVQEDEDEAVDAESEEPASRESGNSDGEEGAAEAESDGTESADAAPDRYRVKREMIINLFGLKIEFSFVMDDEPAKPEARAPKKNSNSNSDSGAKDEAPFSPFVFSVLPGISIPFGTYRTNLAVAAIGGITAEVNGIATSGIFDVIQGDLLGIQSAGIFSVVGGNALGIQSSGIFGVASGNFTGFQSAGVFNVVGADVTLGVQAAGVFNMSRDLTGVQAAGIFNTARQVKGIQAAGVFNVANDVKGAQVAGIVNVANEVRGTQIGLINISKDMYGIPIGLFNFTLNGIRDVGFWQDSSETVYAFWANGSNDFYTIVYAGESQKDWFHDTDTLAVGYGVGARLLRKGLKLDVDASAKHYYGPRFAQALAAMKSDEFWKHAENEDYRPSWGVSPVFPSLRATLGMPIFGKLELFGGLSADIGIQGICELPEETMSKRSFEFRAFGRPVDVSPQLYWGLRY